MKYATFKDFTWVDKWKSRTLIHLASMILKLKLFGHEETDDIYMWKCRNIYICINITSSRFIYPKEICNFQRNAEILTKIIPQWFDLVNESSVICPSCKWMRLQVNEAFDYPSDTNLRTRSRRFLKNFFIFYCGLWMTDQNFSFILNALTFSDVITQWNDNNLIVY